MTSSCLSSKLPNCQKCKSDESLPFDFTMAFHPIVNCQTHEVFGYEALVRGLNNESAFSIISQVNDDNRYLFDQHCRIKAIALAAKLGITSMLSINFLPNAIYKPERCIRTTLEAAEQYDFPLENIMFEFTENEKLQSNQHIKKVVEYYQKLGFKTATDDFGSGYSGLTLLADFQTDIVKFDMELIRGIDKDTVRQTIFIHSLAMLDSLNITALAEGVETLAEYSWIKAQGVRLMQGFLFAKPGFECLPDVQFPD
ncbi:EAL domain-containing protein [Vibrio palustris]|uniref:Blue light-and temperature-regulated antirepressor YcgF n=1 Tax=Vibrio palustris TaxID=1918946 RepID=A0A1R4B699_9VIBR|nr:EAL domain-containing protein [Vibrio palustris]SJL84438.1 Blue light-and temperature-regulated antirepressor YcgF [Vibrio palustris]